MYRNLYLKTIAVILIVVLLTTTNFGFSSGLFSKSFLGEINSVLKTENVYAECNHSWYIPTVGAPYICRYCGASMPTSSQAPSPPPSPLPLTSPPACSHSWYVPTGGAPYICKYCGTLMCDVTGHNYVNGICINCHQLDHTWSPPPSTPPSAPPSPQPSSTTIKTLALNYCSMTINGANTLGEMLKVTAIDNYNNITDVTSIATYTSADSSIANMFRGFVKSGNVEGTKVTKIKVSYLDAEAFCEVTVIGSSSPSPSPSPSLATLKIETPLNGSSISIPPDGNSDVEISADINSYVYQAHFYRNDQLIATRYRNSGTTVSYTTSITKPGTYTIKVVGCDSNNIELVSDSVSFTASTPELTSLELSPSSMEITGNDTCGGAVTVKARYSDGSSKDVTGLTTFTSLDSNVAYVSQSGSTANVWSRDVYGNTTITASYEGESIDLSVLVKLKLGINHSSMEISGLNKLGESLTVTAIDHGTVTDVTAGTIFKSSNSSVADMSGTYVKSGSSSGIATIKAYYGGASYGNSFVTCDVTVVCPLDTDAPSAPGNLRITDSTSESVSLYWNPSTDNVAVSGYNIYRNGSYLQSTTTSTSYKDSTVTPGSKYTYTVRAKDAVLNYSDPSNSADVIVPFDNMPPSLLISPPSESLTKCGPVTYTVTYGGADSITLSASDVVLNKTGTAKGSVSVSGSGKISRTVTISGISGDGTMGISIASGSASNIFGKSQAADSSETFTVANKGPALTISAPSADSTLTGPVTYTVTYTGANNITLSSSDVILNKNGTANGTVQVSGLGVFSRTVTISNITGIGTLSISIKAGTATDALLNSARQTGPSRKFFVGTADGTGSFFYMRLPTVGTDPYLSARNSYFYTNGTERQSVTGDVLPPAGRLFAPKSDNVNIQQSIDALNNTYTVKVSFKWDIDIGAEFKKMKENLPTYFKNTPYFKLVSEMTVPNGWNWVVYNTNLPDGSELFPQDYSTHDTEFDPNLKDNGEIYKSDRVESEVWTLNPEDLQSGIEYFVEYTYIPSDGKPLPNINDVNERKMYNRMYRMKLNADTSAETFESDHGSTLDYIYYENTMGLTGISNTYRLENTFGNRVNFTVACPVNVHIYDSQQRHLGPQSDGTYEEGIPGAVYEIRGDKKFISLLDNDTYRIDIKGEDTGFMNVKVDSVTVNGSDALANSRTVYQNIPVSSTMNAEFISTESQGVSDLQVDNNGDGVKEEEVKPSAVIGEGVQDDKLPPATSCTITGTLGNDGWYNSDVMVSLSSTDEGGGAVFETHYTLDGSELQTYNTPIKVDTDDTHTITFSSVDLQWNYEIPKEYKFKIDKKAPEISIDTDIYMAYGDQYFVPQVAYDNASGVAKTTITINGVPVNVDDAIDLPFGDSIIKVESTDVAGNTAEKTGIIHLVDIVPPESQVSLKGTTGNDGWYISDVKVDITSTDMGGSGVKDIIYELNGKKYSYTQPFTINNEGRNILEVYSVDMSGNEEMPQYYEILIDKTAPEINADITSMPWSKNSVFVSVGCTDNKSLPYKVEYAWSNTTDEPVSWVENDGGAIGQSENGRWYLFVRAYDYAGNITQMMFGEYDIDTTYPTVEASPANSNWVNRDINVSLTYGDIGSGISGVEYLWTDKAQNLETTVEGETINWNKYNESGIVKSEEGNAYLIVKVSDIAGNETLKSFGPYLIDKTLPNISIGAPLALQYKTNEKIKLDFTSVDGISGVVSISAALDGNPVTNGQEIVLTAFTGSHSLIVTSIDNAGNASTKTVNFTVIAIVDGKIKVLSANGNTNAETNTLYPNFKIINNGKEPIKLSDIKVRYYYTTDINMPQNFFCDWSSVGSSNVTGNFVKLDQTKANTDYYLEIGFSNTAGTLEPGGIVEIKSRIAKTGWSLMSQLNDFSFSNNNNYGLNVKTPSYLNGQLQFGQEPDGETISKIEGVKLQAYNANLDASAPTISPRIKLTNTGNTDIKLSELKIRYYYTKDGEINQNFCCDYSNYGTANITGSFVTVTPKKDTADNYFEIGFAPEDGILPYGDTLVADLRFSKSDYSKYIQNNDYSFNGVAKEYVDNIKITVVKNGSVIWGITP